MNLNNTNLKALSLLIMFTPVIGAIFIILGLFITSPLHRCIALKLLTSNRMLVFIPFYQFFISTYFLLELL